MFEHIGRSWHGSVIESECICPKAPCGLVVSPHEDCKEHHPAYAKTIRQSHNPEDCPARHIDHKPWTHRTNSFEEVTIYASDGSALLSLDADVSESIPLLITEAVNNIDNDSQDGMSHSWRYDLNSSDGTYIIISGDGKHIANTDEESVAKHIVSCVNK